MTNGMFREEAVRHNTGGRSRPRPRGFWASWTPRQRVPVVLQGADSDCGAACVAMILALYGRQMRLEEVRELVGHSQAGITALDMVKGAGRAGLHVSAYTAEPEAIDRQMLPAIIHWSFNHFVVLERLDANAAVIIDPARGRRRISREELGRSFTGVILVCEPAPGFTPRTVTRKWWSRPLQVALGSRHLLGFIVALSVILQILGLALPALTALIVDRVLPARATSTLLLTAAAAATVIAAQTASMIARGRLLLRLQAALDHRITGNFFRHLLSLPYPFFQQRSSGDLLTRLASNSTIRELLSVQIPSMVIDSGLVLTYLVLMFVYHPALALVVALFGAVQLLLAVIAVRRGEELVQRDVLSQSRAQSYLIESLRGIETLKSAGLEPMALRRWQDFYSEQLSATMARQRLSSFMSSFTTGVSTAAPLTLLIVGAWAVIDGRLSIGSMLGFSALAVAFIAPISSVVSNIQRFETVGTHLRRVEEIFETAPEREGGRVAQLDGQIALRNVTFRYGSTLPAAVDEVTLDVRAGEFIAIVGRSGSGKSTLAKLMLGLYEPTSGRIELDGIDALQLDRTAIRSQLGIVMQTGFLFRDTIRQNIALFRDDITIVDVTEAARLACIHDEITALPMRYETLLGEGANNLSGGQRQRLNLARALARKPRILLLDEPTSELDRITEEQVNHALLSLDCTRIVISHRLSAVKHAGQIVVMDSGRIVERGPHAELIERGGHYHALVSGDGAR